MNNPESPEEVAHMFAEVMGWGALEVLAAILDSKVGVDEYGRRPDCMRNPIDEQDVLQMIGVHCSRATVWGVRAIKPQRFYHIYEEEHGRRPPIGVRRYKMMLSNMTKLTSDDVGRIEHRVSAGMRACCNQGAERVVDEWLDSFLHGTWYFVRDEEAQEALKKLRETFRHRLNDEGFMKEVEVNGSKYLVYIPRKPHKVGHLHFLLASKVKMERTDVDGNVQESYCVFAHDIMSYFKHPKVSPDHAFRVMTDRNAGDPSDLKLTIGDEAFNTQDTLVWAERSKHKILLSGVSVHRNVKKHSVAGLIFNEYRYMLGPNGLVMTILHGSTRVDEDFGEEKKQRKVICNLSNYLHFGAQEKCTCAKITSHRTAMMLQTIPERDLRNICAISGAQTSTNKLEMVRALTGWNLAAGEEPCGFCHGSAIQTRFHDVMADVQKARFARMEELSGKEWTAAKLKTKMAELGLKVRSSDKKETMAGRIACTEQAYKGDLNRMADCFRAQLQHHKKTGACETSDRYTAVSVPFPRRRLRTRTYHVGADQSVCGDRVQCVQVLRWPARPVRLHSFPRTCASSHFLSISCNQKLIAFLVPNHTKQVFRTPRKLQIYCTPSNTFTVPPSVEYSQVSGFSAAAKCDVSGE